MRKLNSNDDQFKGITFFGGLAPLLMAKIMQEFRARTFPSGPATPIELMPKEIKHLDRLGGKYPDK